MSPGMWNTSDDLVKTMYFLTFLSVFILSVTGDGDDFTCYNHYPRLTTNGETDAYIGGFTSGEDIDANVTFERTFDTFTGVGLPSGSYQEGNLLRMPSGGIERIGVFSCIFQKGGTTYIIPMMNQHKHANVLPTRFSITANKGDKVDIVMQSSIRESWRIDGSEVIRDWNDQTTVTLPNVDTNDAGVYECYKRGGGRPDGLQAFTRLIVRECSANKWGPPSCQNDCRLCYNGGVCHDQSGLCVCAPGFSGTRCESVHGRNQFGQDGQISCSDTDPHGDGCKGRLFCLPDPYGCSCGAGYQGLDCNTECNKGNFGADCKQDCHCMIGNTDCLLDTGECPNGGCATGWTGVNCQVLGQVTNLKVDEVSSQPTTLDVSWVGPQPLCAEKYIVQYQLTNLDQCDEQIGQKEHFWEGTDTSVTITGLQAYSTYTVFVSSHNSNGSIENSEPGNTAIVVPSGKPTNVRNTATAKTSLTYHWSNVQCGQRGGPITFKYQLEDSNGTNVKSGTTTEQNPLATIDGLISCSTYNFKVQASTSAGDSDFTAPIEGITDMDFPGPIESLATDDITSYTWMLSWDPQVQNPCQTNDYVVEYRLLRKDQCEVNDDPTRVTYGTVSDTVATITNLYPYSTYEVFLYPRNNLGNGPERSLVDTTREIVPLAPPENVLSSTRTSTSLSFTWDQFPCGKRGGDNSYEYVLRGETEDIHSGTTSELFVIITGLIPCSTYSFIVRAFSSAGYGNFSNPVEGTTYVTPLGPVQSLSTADITSNTWSLSWDPQKESLCQTDYYIVQYKFLLQDQCESNRDPTRIEYGNVTDTFVNITKLQPYSTYQVYVYPRNDFGDGLEESFTDVTGEEAPSGQPENVTNTETANTSLSFAWYNIPCGQRGGSITFEYHLGDSDGNNVGTGMTTEHERFATLGGLAPCSSYNFEVKATTSAGDGEFATPVEATTDNGGQSFGPVQYLSTVGITSNTWSLSWDPPEENLCPTDYYIVQYKVLLQDQCEFNSDPTRIEYGHVTDTFVNITKLHPYSTYEVFVYPRNDFGDGLEDSFIDVTGESAPSGPPIQIISVADKYLIKFTWEEPSCGNRNGITQHYLYTFEPGNREDTTEFKNVTFEGLNPCTKYIFAISAVTSIGQGPQDLITTTTREEVPYQPSNLWLQNKGLREISVAWDEPKQIFCPIISYTITIRTFYKPYDKDFSPSPEPEYDVQGLLREYTFTKLSPSTEYEFKVFAHTKAGHGDFILNNFSTSPADEEELGEPLQKPQIVQSNATTLTLEIPQLTGAESEFLTDFKIYVERPNVYVLAQSPDPHTSYEVGTVQKTEVEDEPKEFVVGSGQTEQNPPLEIGQKYKIYIGSCSVIRTDQACVWSPPVTHGFSKQETNDDIVWIVVVTLLSAIIAGVVGVTFIGILISKQRKRDATRTLDQRDGQRQQQLEMDPYTNLGLVDEPAPYEDMHIQSSNTNWTISWTDLELSDNILGKGSFGEVREGVCKRGGQYLPVAVKTVNSKATGKDKSDFYSEFETMKKIGHHRNIVSLIGACEYEGTLYVALEYVACGDLRTYLRITRRRNQKGASHQVPPKKLLQFAFDVAKGMEHLSSIGIIHRDLAARNILLSDDLVAKVSDFGMSRGEDVYVKTSKQRVPTRWLAIESLCYSTYTTKSDVWSFAVLLWEIATFGATPYSDIATRDLAGLFSEGYRLPKPASLDSAVYDMMTQCWSIDPEERPSFTQIAAKLGDMHTHKQRVYVDTRAYENLQFPAISPERDDN